MATNRKRVPHRRNSSRRLAVIVVLIALAFSGVAARLAVVQVAGADSYRERGEDQRVRRVALAAERGAIVDRNGLPLAVSMPAETVWADPRVIDDPAGYAAQLAPIVGADEAELAQRLGQSDLAFVYVARQVTEDVVAAVEALDLPGVATVPESRREYPATGLASPVLGFVGTENTGLGGLESAYDELLTGTPGELIVEQDPRGREIPRGQRQITAPERGLDLVLTLDQSIQYEAEQALVEGVVAAGAKGGTAIVLDVATGSILALASVEATEGGIVPAPADTHATGITDVYEPGSTNKVITVAGAIEDGVVAADTHFSVPYMLDMGGYTFEDHEPHGVEWWSVADILRQSSNIGAIMVGQQLGRDRFDHYVRAFGFGSPSGLGFPGESEGIILPLDQYTDSSMGSMPIGNGLAVTALQMLNVYATIANGGLQREPRLVDAVIDAEGERIAEPAGTERHVVSPQTANVVTEMLRGVVSDGTGTRAAVPGYPIAGKTGTARKPPYDQPPYRYVASFAGFAPADAPRLATIVVIDEPTASIYGGVVAAPTFARIMQLALRHERVVPTEPVVGAIARPGEWFDDTTVVDDATADATGADGTGTVSTSTPIE